MAVQKLNLQKEPLLNRFNLEEPFVNDKWDILSMDIYKNASLKHQQFWKVYGHSESSVLNFLQCKNPYVREELKYFLFYLITEQNSSLYNFTNVEARMRHLIQYINTCSIGVYSIIHIEEQEFTKFLLKEGIIPSKYMISGNIVNSKMEKQKTTRKHRTVALLGYIQSVIKKYKPMSFSFDMDFWEIKNFSFIDMSKSSNRKNLNFEPIQQKEMKKQIKRYCYHRLHITTASTVAKNLGSLVSFVSWLHECFPEINWFKDVSRDMIEDYILFLRTETNCSDRLAIQKISDLKIFLETGRILELDNFPTSILILPQDCIYKNHIMPEIYSNQEMKNINAILKDIPNIYAKIILCLEQLALRIEDLLRLTSDSLSEKDNNTYVLQLIQGKTSNLIEIYLKKSLYDLLLDQYEISKELYGSDVKYIFASSKDEHISYSTVLRTINNEFYRLNVKNDNGDILRFKTHKFRATKASKLLEMGYDAETAAKSLGHSGLNSLAHYGKVTNDLMIATMEPFLKKVDILVNNIGQVQDIPKSESKNAIPLCNGWCCRPISSGVCLHANYCLNCSMFKPDIRYLNYYSIQLEEVNATLAVAELDKNMLLVKKLQQDKKQLEKIIEKVKSL